MSLPDANVWQQIIERESSSQPFLPREHETGKISSCGHILRVPLVVHPDAQPSDLDFSSHAESANASILPAAAVPQFLDYYSPSPEVIRVYPGLAHAFMVMPLESSRESHENLIRAIEWLVQTNK